MSFIDRNELTLDCSGFRANWLKPQTIRMPESVTVNTDIRASGPPEIDVAHDFLNRIEEEIRLKKCTCECVKGGKVPPVDKLQVREYYRYIPDWLQVDRVIFHNPATIVFWKNGEKTVVKCAENETYNEYAGFCAAVAKQVFRTNSTVNRIVRNAYREPEKPVSEQRKEKSDDIDWQLEYMKARILELRDQGYSCADISGVTGYSESTVRNVIKDAEKAEKGAET